MNIWIDDHQITDAPDLDTALERARVHAESKGRLIIDILVDGEPATDALFDEDASTLPAINELRFTTANTNEMVHETLQTTIESIELLKADQAAGVQQLREGHITDSMESMRAIMEGWQAIRDIVDQIAQITNIDIFTLQEGDQTGAQLVESLSKALAEVRETLNTEDWSSLGDIIEYDLTELADQWSTLLLAMQTIGSTP